MKIARALLVTGLLALLGCGKGLRPEDSKPEPVESSSIHSLSINFADAPARTVISGMMHFNDVLGFRDVFYFTGPLDGRALLTAPIGKDTLAVKCSAVGCADFEFPLRWKDHSLASNVKAHVFRLASVQAHWDAVLDPAPEPKYDTRVHWQTLLKSEIDLTRSTIVEAHYGKARFLTIQLVSKSNASAFAVTSPSEGGAGKVEFDYRLTALEIWGGGHAEGEATLVAGKGRVQLPGGFAELTLK